MIPFALMNGPVTLPQFDSAVIGGSSVGTTFIAYFSFTITSNTTTNVGIKIPMVRQNASNLNSASSNNLTVQSRAVIGDNPNYLSSTGMPGGLYNPISNPNGYRRDQWTLSTDANFIYIFTSNATQKNNLVIGTTYWFGHECAGGANDVSILLTSNTTSIFNSTGPTINFLRAPNSGNATGYNKFMIINVLDYNA
jgi:hypothetical protein